MTDGTTIETPSLAETPPPKTIGKGPIVATEYWRMLEDGRVECEMCPRFCKLKEGARGLCFVQKPAEGIVYT